MSKKSSLPILVILIGLAFALRVYRLDASPLRGDEAFAVRYWAAPPADVLSHLAWVEPHPFGTFFGFWLWKSLAGGTEFAMRMLPALLNLLGVPAMYALGRRLFNDRLIGLIAAFLWAINPNLIWHSQDVRNYAIWAGLSAVSMGLLLRASDRSRRADWALYVLFETITLYVFFLEAFIVVVQALYVLLFRRKALHSWGKAMLIVGVLLIPWFGQLWALAHSGYGGAAAGADLGKVLSQFWQSLVFGETLVSLFATSEAGIAFLLGALVVFAASLLFLGSRCPTAAKFVLLWLFVPAALLTAAAARLNVFLPRYLIAATPAALLPLAWLPSSVREQRTQSKSSRIVNLLAASLITEVYVVIMVIAIPSYVPKAPDWYSLRDYLRSNTTSADTVIMTSLDPQTGNADPAFEYYYNGPANVVTLPHPGFDVEAVVQKALEESRAVWFIVSGSDIRPINDALLSNGVLISDQGAGRSFLVRQYRARTVKPDKEVETPLKLSIGDSIVYGYSILGELRTGSTLTVLLFWQQPNSGLTTFVHLIGPAKPDGSTLWTQDDHPPAAGRDVYHLDLSSVPPGQYMVEIGLYDAKTNQRAPITDLTTGKTPGDSYTLATISIRGK